MDKKVRLISIILMLFAGICWLVLINKERTLKQAYKLTMVLVAKYDLPANTVLKMDILEVIPIPRKFMQQDAYEIIHPADLKLVTNLVTAIRIPKGNQITKSSLLSPGMRVKISTEGGE